MLVRELTDHSCTVDKAEGTGSKAPRGGWDPCSTPCFAMKWDGPFLWGLPLARAPLCVPAHVGGSSALQAVGWAPHHSSRHSLGFFGLADYLLW